MVDVGSGVATTIAYMAEAIASYYGAPQPVVNAQFLDGDVRAASADVTAASEWLGWKPTVSLEVGVAALQEWIAKQL